MGPGGAGGGDGDGDGPVAAFFGGQSQPEHHAADGAEEADVSGEVGRRGLAAGPEQDMGLSVGPERFVQAAVDFPRFVQADGRFVNSPRGVGGSSGQQVEFEAGQGRKGPEATNVRSTTTA